MSRFREEYNSLHQLLDTLASRPNNEAMHGEYSGDNDDEEFYGTRDYQEAEHLARYGYLEPLPQLKEELRKHSKFLDETVQGRKSKPKNEVVGFIPNVPNFLTGIPESMISIEQKPIKHKTMWIFYIMTGNCFVDKELFYKAGRELLKAIYYIEKAGVRVKLDVCFFFAENSGDQAIASVAIKHYGQKLDLQKVCFPLIHPGMFRRLGFKWIETVPGLTDGSWSFGYGRSMSEKVYGMEEELGLGQARVIDALKIDEMGYDINKILKHLKYYG